MNPMERRLIEERLIISEELLLRKQNDPLLTFPLYPKQREFVDSIIKRKKKENWFIAGNRSGKSDSGAYAGALLARFGNQDPGLGFAKADGSSIEVRDRATSGWVSALDFPVSRDTIQPKYFDNGFCPPGAAHDPFIPKREVAEWRVSDQILKLKNGSIIGFKSADSGRDKYMGAEKDWVHLDEEHPEELYNEIIIRVGTRPLRLFGTCTLLPPEGQVGGVTWIYDKKVRPFQRGELKDIGLFNASIYDNPGIPREEIEYLESVYPVGSMNRRIRLEGEMLSGYSGARLYAGFNFKLNVRKQPEIALRRPLCWLWDFNVQPMVSLIGQKDRGLFRVFHELVLEEGSIPEMCEAFRRIHPYHMAEIWVYGDASGGARSHAIRGQKTSYQVILQEMMDYAVPLRLKVPDKNPLIVDRVNAVNRAFSSHGGEVCAEIDPACEELIADFEQVVSDGKGGIKKSSRRNDPYSKRTHLSDAYGYWVWAEAPIRPMNFTENQRKAAKIKPPGYSIQYHGFS